MDKPPQNKTNHEALQMPDRTKAAKPGKRDLRELARSLGLGVASSKSPAAKSATKPAARSSGDKS